MSDYTINRKVLITTKLIFMHILYVHGAWDGVTQEELENMDDFKTYFDSTYTVFTTTLELLLSMRTHTTTLAYNRLK